MATAYLAPAFNQAFPEAPLGYLHTYDTGTTTPKAAYQDQAGLTSHTLPTAGVPASGITLDSYGRPSGGFFLGSGEYTMHLYSAAGALIKTWSDVGATLVADLAADTGSDMVGHDGVYVSDDATIGDIINWGPYELIRGMPDAERAAIIARTSTYNAYTRLQTIFDNMAAAKRYDVRAEGLYQVGTAVELPRHIKITGSQRRSFGGAGTWRGAIFEATGTNGVFTFTAAAATPGDALIEHVGIYGTGTGTPDGLKITGLSGVSVRYCTISNFGHDCLASLTANSYGTRIEEVYCSQAGRASVYLEQEKCEVRGLQSDGGLYSLLTASSANDLLIVGGFLEGAETYIAQIAGRYTSFIGVKLLSTYDGASILLLKATAGHASLSGQTALRGVDGTGAPPKSTPIGIEVEAGCTQWSFDNTTRVSGCAIAVRLREGSGQLDGGDYGATTTAIDLIAGTYKGRIGGGVRTTAGTNSILHTSGNRLWHIGEAFLRNADDSAYLPMTVTAGTPVVTWGNTAHLEVTDATYTVRPHEDGVITANRGAGTVTLTWPAATSYPGCTVRVCTITANTVVSASANIVPATGAAASTAILAATDGAWADVTSCDGVWQIKAQS